MRLFSLLVASMVLLTGLAATATTLQSAHYDESTQTLHVTVVRQGGLKPHVYSLEWDSCQTREGVQEIAARLVDSGWDDTGTEEVVETLSFDLSTLSCRPSWVTVRSGRYSNLTIWVGR
ncbi:MAG: hypothetical protein ACK5Y2_00805 [Bdellovibrionales bacterium]